MYFDTCWFFCCSRKLLTDSGDCSCWRKPWKLLVDTAKDVLNGEVHSLGADLQTQDVSGGTGIAHQVLQQASPGALWEFFEVIVASSYFTTSFSKDCLFQIVGNDGIADTVTLISFMDRSVSPNSRVAGSCKISLQSLGGVWEESKDNVWIHIQID